MTKYIGIIRKEFNNPKFPVFTITDIKVLLSKTRINHGYLKILINHMMNKGEIKRIKNGFYTFHNDITVVGFAYSPFYYGLEDALSYRNVWNQSTNPTVMTTRGVREGLKKFEGSNYIVKRIKPKFFFGFNFMKYYDMWIPVSDPEKTFIDLLYYKHGIRNEALNVITRFINKERLEEYLKSYSVRFRKKVIKILDENMQKLNTVESAVGIAKGAGPFEREKLNRF